MCKCRWRPHQSQAVHISYHSITCMPARLSIINPPKAVISDHSRTRSSHVRYEKFYYMLVWIHVRYFCVNLFLRVVKLVTNDDASMMSDSVRLCV
jgi:hypothetical protein